MLKAKQSSSLNKEELICHLLIFGDKASHFLILIFHPIIKTLIVFSFVLCILKCNYTFICIFFGPNDNFSHNESKILLHLLIRSKSSGIWWTDLRSSLPKSDSIIRFVSQILFLLTITHLCWMFCILHLFYSKCSNIKGVILKLIYLSFENLRLILIHSTL